MNILHISWEYPPLVYGGLGRHVHGLATAQAHLGHNVAILTQRPEGSLATEVLEGVTIHRVEPPTPSVPTDPAALASWATDLDVRFAGSVGALIDESKPDVVHGHDWVVGNTLSWVHVNTSLPTVATFHATESGRHQGWITSDVSKHIHAAERQLATTADRIITCSRSMKDDVATLFDVDLEQIDVTPNGISLSSWRASRSATTDRERFAAKSTFLVVFAGRLEWEKGVHTLIEAVRQIAGIKLIIAGTGTRRKAFQSEASDLVIAGRVDFIGWIPDTDLRALLRSADVVVVPSLYEPFGIAALEAAAAGAPLIVSDVGGLADIVTDGIDGLLFQAENSVDLTDKLATVRDDPDSARLRALRLKNALPHRFDWRKIAAQTLATYQRATKKPS